MVARKASRSQGRCRTGAGCQYRVSWGQRVSKRKATSTAGKQKRRVDDITQDRVVDIARAGQGEEHDEGTTGWRTERGRAERMAWQESKTEWKARIRAGNGMSWQGRTGPHMAGQGTAWHGRSMGRSTFSAGQGRVVAGTGAGAWADSKQGRIGQCRGSGKDRAWAG